MRQHYPLRYEATTRIGHVAIRNRGTVGGSIAHADPAAELPAVLLAHGGSVQIQGPRGTRQIAADQLFRTYLTTALEPDAILTEVRFPHWPAGTGWCFLEESRRHGDFAMVGVAVLLTLDAARLRDVAQAAASEIAPDSAIHAPAEFRRHLSAVLTQRALRKAAERAAP